MRKIFIASPFFSSRKTFPLDMIVIHHIGSDNGKLYSLGGAISWFTDIEAHKNKDTGKIENQVSAHYIIPRAPYKDLYDAIQFVKNEDVAWHAGDSTWMVDGKPRRYINSYSIGIELEGDGNFVDYTDYQYQTLIELVKELVALYKIPEKNIVGHEDICPGRKVDPGKLFDWKRFRTGVYPPVVESAIVIGPVSGTDAAPAPSPQTPQYVPDKDFHMGGGTNNVGSTVGTWVNILRAVLKIFGINI